MNAAELDNFLFRYTESEIKHKKAGEPRLSERYQLIPKTSFQDREVYLFSFQSLLENKLICVHKESRFTFQNTFIPSSNLYMYTPVPAYR